MSVDCSPSLTKMVPHIVVVVVLCYCSVLVWFSVHVCFEGMLGLGGIHFFILYLPDISPGCMVYDSICVKKTTTTKAGLLGIAL